MKRKTKCTFLLALFCVALALIVHVVFPADDSLIETVKALLLVGASVFGFLGVVEMLSD